MTVAGRHAARRLLRRTLSAVRRDVALCLVSGVAWQAVAVAVPWVLEQAVDDGIVAGDRRALWVWSGVIVVLGLVRWWGDAARHWWVERAGAHAADHLRRRLVDRVLRMDDDTFGGFGHGDLTSRAVDDTDTVWNWVAGIATLVTATFTLLAVLILLVAADPALAVIGLATVPLAAVFAARQVGVHGRAAAASAEGTGGYASAVESAIAGVRTVKGLGAERVVLDRAVRRSEALRANALALARVEAWWLAVAAAIPAAGIAAGLWVGGQRALEGSLSVGALVAFAGWMGLLVDATVTLTERLTDRGAALAAAGRLAEVLAPDRTPAVRFGSMSPVPGAGDVAVDGATVRRGGRVVLRGIDLDVAAGEWVAVVGETGAGKTSLLRVVAGQDAPSDGTVRFGGVDVRDFDPSERRRHVSLVPQGSALVSGTVSGVLRLAAPDATDGELVAAITAAGAGDVVTGLGGLDGHIGDRGLSLSGGQRQRLALAMALVRRPAVLLLDDTTSALDPSTEACVLASVRAHLPDSSVVVATHRAATAAACDRAVVLADGGMVDTGGSDVTALLGDGREAHR